MAQDGREDRTDSVFPGAYMVATATAMYIIRIIVITVIIVTTTIRITITTVITIITAITITQLLPLLLSDI